jgi:hypothetical protein
MATGTLALAWLFLVAGQSPPVDTWPINQRNFKIPIVIDPARRTELKELTLWVSEDQGRTWRETAAVGPDQTDFMFYAPNDGVYWFTLCVVDKQGNRDPADIAKAPVRQKILVDTLKPVLRLVTAERQGEDAFVAWEIQEDHLDPTKFKLEFSPADAPSWKTAACPPSPKGDTRIRLGFAGPALVRLQVEDTAGNLATAEKQIPAVTGGVSLAGGVPPTPAPFQPPLNNFSFPPNNPNPALAVAEPRPPVDARPAIEPAYGALDPNGGPSRPWAGAGDRNIRPVATTPPPQPVPTAAAFNAPGARFPTGGSSGVQIVNTTQLVLNYKVDNVGPSGVGEVELYVTQDDGQNWKLLARDTSARPPLTVNLPGEGIYGFTLVVKSKAGLGKKPPKPGDLPQMRVEVDTTPPHAKLYVPEPVPGRNDTLALYWIATDRNLAPNPITLQWAERASGPWQTIAANLPNTGGHPPESTGGYQWQLPPQFPERVYLRITVQDTAGNSNTGVSEEPALVDLSEPTGVLLGVAGAPRP